MYKTGSIAVTNNSAIVTGSGTLWVDAGVLNPGDLIFCPDGTLQEVLSFQSNTQLTLAGDGHGNTVYLGATLAGQAYGIVPIGMLPSSLALQVKTTLTAAQTAIGSAVLHTAAQGLTTTQQNNARANILALGAADVGKGLLVKSVAGGVEVVLTAAEASNQFIELTGALTANINLVVPAAARLFVIRNSTTGAYTVTVKTAAGTGVTALQGGRMLIECDGTNCVDAMSSMRQTGGSIDGTPIGGTTPAAVAATTLAASASTVGGATAVLDSQSATGNQIYAKFTAGATVLGDMYRNPATNSVNLSAYYGNVVLRAGSGGTATDIATVSAIGLAVTGVLSSFSNTTYQARVATALGNYTSGGMVFGGYGADANDAGYYGAVGYDHTSNSTYLRNRYAGVTGKIVFQTATASDTFTQAMTLDASGNLLVGQTTPSASGAHCLTSNGANYTLTLNQLNSVGSAVNLVVANTAGTAQFLRCNAAGADKLIVATNGNVTNVNNSYGAISDLKLKENITDATPKLAKLLQVRIVNYNLKTDPLHKQIGVIAQELELISPGLIEETPDYIEVTKTREVAVPEVPAVDAVLDAEGAEITPAIEAIAATTRTEEYTEREATGEVTKSVKYSVFVPMLIKAMQEQQALIDSLTSRLTALETA